MSAANPLGTILGVWAHPDDETWLCGGLMARAVRAADRVVCITATRGELGSPDEERWPNGPALAAVRTAEMETALAHLGVSEHHWLDYPDGSCAEVDQEDAVRRITEVMQRVQPDTVLTFGPDGMTGHDDHRAASRWASEAFARFGKPGAALSYATKTPDWLARFRAPMDALNVFMSAEPPRTPVEELSVHFELTGDVLAAKMRAMQSMTSQLEPLIHALGENFFREAMVEESFRAA